LLQLAKAKGEVGGGEIGGAPTWPHLEKVRKVSRTPYRRNRNIDEVWWRRVGDIESWDMTTTTWGGYK
jgi:hypothetical protein